MPGACFRVINIEQFRLQAVLANHRPICRIDILRPATPVLHCPIHWIDGRMPRRKPSGIDQRKEGVWMSRNQI